MLLESSIDRYNESARLISPIFKGEQSLNACLKFFYHMYGQSVGSLMVFIKPESEDIEKILSEEKYRLWKLTGTQKNTWHETTVNMEEIKESFQIVIEGTSIGSNLGDIGIDDVSLISSEECWNEIPETTTEETGGIFSTETCMNRCDEVFTMVTYPDKRITKGPGTGGYIKSCYCFNGCERVDLCCPDYQSACLFNDSIDTTSDTTESKDIIYASRIVYYEEAAVNITEEQISTTTKSYEKIANETEMNSVKIMEKIEKKVEEKSSWGMITFWTISIILICGLAFYGIYYKFFRNSTTQGLEVRFSRDDTEELLEYNVNHV